MSNTQTLVDRYKKLKENNNNAQTFEKVKQLLCKIDGIKKEDIELYGGSSYGYSANDLDICIKTHDCKPFGNKLPTVVVKEEFSKKCKRTVKGIKAVKSGTIKKVSNKQSAKRRLKLWVKQFREFHREEKINTLNKVYCELCKMEDIQDLNKKYGKCPILNFTIDGMEIDLSVDNNSAIENTKFIKSYMDFDIKIEAFTYYIKEANKEHGLINGQGGKFNSTMVVFMVINYLIKQEIVPNILNVSQFENEANKKFITEGPKLVEGQRVRYVKLDNELFRNYKEKLDNFDIVENMIGFFEQYSNAKSTVVNFGRQENSKKIYCNKDIRIYDPFVKRWIISQSIKLEQAELVITYKGIIKNIKNMLENNSN